MSPRKDVDSHSNIIVYVTIDTKMLVEVLEQKNIYEYHMAQYQDKYLHFKRPTTTVNNQFTNE